MTAPFPEPKRHEGRASRRAWARLSPCALAGLALAGCSGPQSWIDPAGPEAASVARLFAVMAAGGGVVWALVVGLTVFASRIRPSSHSELWARRFVVWGGMALPTAVLFALLLVSLGMMAEGADGPADMEITARGEQWWWRIAYPGPDGEPVPVPNELRLPRGRVVEVELTADDVIHSFWVPAIGGKMDMIPGRTNRVRLLADKAGTYRGQCAEFCGEAHAQMAFPVVVMPPEAFAGWLARQARPAVPPRTEEARRGRDLFLATGCGACHAVRGTPADGPVGPDLTHVASRRTIGAGLLPTSREAFARWIAETDRVKPGVHMPAFGMLPDDEVAAIAAYLAGLE